MSQTGLPSNGGKKIKPPPPPPDSDPLSSTCRRRSSPYMPQQHMAASNRSGSDALAAQESFRIAMRFFLNQPVNVNIEGRGWLLGTVVLLAKGVQSLTESVVRVRYTVPTERNERESDFPNHPNHIRPR